VRSERVERVKMPKMLSVGLGILTASVVGAGMDVGADIEGVRG
jgi:hypothetical protein